MSATYRALSYEYSVSAPGNRALSDYLDEILSAQRAERASDPEPYFIRPVAWGELTRHELVRADERLVVGETPETLVSPLVQQVNARAVQSWTAGPVCHAAGVVHRGAAMVLPAQQEAGKTTLATGLVRAGYDYLSDEAVAFDDDGVITPFPKPLSIDPGSWPLFPDLEPVADLPTTAYKQEQWQVPPEAIRLGAIGGTCTARWIVFPRYQAGADTLLHPVTRAEALVEIAHSTFGFAADSERRLEQLADIVREAECYRLSVGSLDAACDVLRSLMGSTEAR